MEVQILEYGSTEHLQMIALRNEVLRKPIGMSISFEDAAGEKADVLIGACINGKITGCCLLTKINNDTLQLKQMCVDPSYHKQGIGMQLLRFAEDLATDQNFKKIVMHARETAVGFYQLAGYKAIGQQFIEVTLPHYEMCKELN